MQQPMELDWPAKSQVLRFGELAQTELTVMEELVEIKEDAEDSGDTTALLSSLLKAERRPLLAPGVVRAKILLSTDSVSDKFFLDLACVF